MQMGVNTERWFINVPIGNHAVINISSERFHSKFDAYEAFEIVKRIYPSLLPLENKLVNIGYLQGAALQKLRSKRGDGSWEEEIGSLFVDINDYSRLADDLGEHFTNFVSSIYIPSLIKAASQFAASEHVAGDEVYFIVTQDFLPTGMSIPIGAEHTLLAIDNFVFGKGAEICGHAGFAPLSVSIGVNVGVGHIIADSVSVRTTGKTVNHAKRLQEEAGRGGVLVAAASGLTLSSIGYALGEEILIQKKKQIVLGRRVLRSRAQSRNNLQVA